MAEESTLRLRCAGEGGGEVSLRTYNEDNIKCPKCGYVFRDSCEFDGDDGEVECGECDAVISYSRNISVSYSATVKEVGK